jgi:hypothetical protein
VDLEAITRGEPAAEAEFTCSLGHGRAGAVRLYRAGGDHVFDDEMPGWLEETRGGCPRGHDRMLVD